MQNRTGGLAALILASVSLGLAAPAFAQDASPSGSPVGPLAASPAASGAPMSGSAHVLTSGLVEADLVLPIQASMTYATDAGFELRFQDATLDTLNITLAGSGGLLTDAFVGVGVPGASIFDAAYFADFVHSQCTVTMTSMDASDVAGSIECTELANGDDSGAIDVQATFSTGPIATPGASASPAY